jgi:hypothetical protein
VGIREGSRLDPVDPCRCEVCVPAVRSSHIVRSLSLVPIRLGARHIGRHGTLSVKERISKLFSLLVGL